MSANIHPTAVVESGAELGSGVVIGPFCVVGSDVTIGDNCELLTHVVVAGRTTLGPGNKLYPFASIGHQPQDLKYHGEPSELVIGANNQIREHVTMNPGTEGGGMVTKVADNCLFMTATHVGHDCQIGNGVIMANNATLAGHVEVQDFAVLGGLSAVHQFVRIGRHSMVGGMTGVERDVIPFGSVVGDRARLSGINLIGMKRRGFDRDAINAVRKCYRLLFADEGTFQERLDEVAREFADTDAVMEIVDFIRADSSRKICQPVGNSDEL